MIDIELISYNQIYITNNLKMDDYEQEDLAEDLMRSWYSKREVADELNMDESDLTQMYLDNWHWIKETAEELGLDEEELLEEYWDDYDYE